ncbi:hypothetical protein JOB18_028106 [Solea senegalensis]|uniref:Uncharacterized protein n=1 Tax=Solea senegalensis TaxID=28829 RepID=A0AAV6RCH5_SOLSE|nr:hypothetical protein JOB18_028106 [Solea senegalensis]
MLLCGSYHLTCHQTLNVKACFLIYGKLGFHTVTFIAINTYSIIEWTLVPLNCKVRCIKPKTRKSECSFSTRVLDAFQAHESGLVI